MIMKARSVQALTGHFHQSDKHSYVPMLYQNVFLIGNTTKVYKKNR